MSSNPEEGQSWVRRMFGQARPPQDHRLTQQAAEVHHAMKANGYEMNGSGVWVFKPELVEKTSAAFKGQQTTFFGPVTFNEVYMPTGRQKGSDFVSAFNQPEVTNSLNKLRQQDTEKAGRVAFILGGVVREQWLENGDERKKSGEIDRAVKYCATMTALGDARSSDAIATAIAMYIKSGGSLDADSQFKSLVFRMGEAVSEDKVKVKETRDLGLSQVGRLRSFATKIAGERPSPLPDITAERKAFADFPTVGAEFHLRPDAANNFPNFWERLALLNISQYQPDSYIQMSRNDRDVVEIRMNPAEYPVTIANWNRMRLMLPELNKAYFTITFNQQDKNFDWGNRDDAKFIGKLKALAYLGYTGLAGKISPTSQTEEIDFGTGYLGQTYKVKNGTPEFSGQWAGGKGNHGQLGLYVGHGDLMPYLAYYLSMGLVDPETVLKNTEGILSKAPTLREAAKVDEQDRRLFFTKIQNRILRKKKLNDASNAGIKILDALNP